MTPKVTHMLQVPALRIAILAILVLSLIGLGWVFGDATDSVSTDPSFIPQSMTVPAPPVTVTVAPRIITKVVIKTKTVIKKVPGPIRTVYVSRAKARTHVTNKIVTHVAPGGVAACIRKWESGSNYTAQNPSSTASGAYQFLDTTWQGVTGLSGRAMNYPPATQDAAFYKLWAGGAGRNQWVTQSHC